MSYYGMASEYPEGYCPYFHQTIELIGRRWTGAIFLAVYNGTEHFGDIRSAIPGLSDRLLCERLTELGAAGIVERRTDGRSVSYTVSPKGQALGEALVDLQGWAHEWVYKASDGKASAVPVE